MEDASSTITLDSVDLTDDMYEDAQLLKSPKQRDFINFNSRRIRLTILTTIYYIWVIPTLSIDINTLNGNSSSGGGGGGGGGNHTLSDDDKTVYKLIIAGNVFLLIGSMLTGLDLFFYLYENPKFVKYIRYICGIFYLLGSIFHIAGASKKWNVHCIDNYDDSWCRSAYYSVDFFAELFSLIMVYDIIMCENKNNYLNQRKIRIAIYAFILFLTSFIFAIDYGYYVKPLTDPDRDNLSGYWIVAITTCTIYCSIIIRMIVYPNSDKIGNVVGSNDKNIPTLMSKMQYFDLMVSVMLITGTALCWIKPSVIMTVGTEQPLYRKQFLMFIGVAMIIAYDLQFV